MAYAASVTSTMRVVAGRRVHTVVVTETEVVDANSEWSWAGFPIDGVVTWSKTTFIAGDDGTATTCQPRIGETTTGTEVYSAAAAAASDRNATDRRYKAITANTLYGSSRLNGTTAGAGSVITRLVVLEGGF